MPRNEQPIHGGVRVTGQYQASDEVGWAHHQLNLSGSCPGTTRRLPSRARVAQRTALEPPLEQTRGLQVLGEEGRRPIAVALPRSSHRTVSTPPGVRSRMGSCDSSTIVWVL